ncbi:MBL fold metallo-hydrolase [Planotetraspora sp. A-T 1434]|uniref:MBL fold metallo-hydrolase n=1 Tax=Planotetraspora sp. A-T 1434 TaxID=2979219 RepID=UPI0021BEA3EE|nr:MBL fold metallo-hydrolase [Planotetraspora sp. A-T 1434]MCT9932318.1 MBL fold metallo-hydrolase [Planotetraspora sp. A-T 1434]
MGHHIRKPLPEMFPGGSFSPDAEWILHFHCYLLRAAGRTVLVDTGIGGADSPAAGWAPVPGRLPEELSAVGVHPADVDAVVLTHLHSDHASGSIVAGAPAFPNARYVIQQAELDWVTGPMLDQVVAPLRDSLQIVYGDAELFPGIRVVHTPGHTPGHQCVEVGDFVVSGDVVLHPVQVADPAVAYVYDEDPELAVRTRTALLDRAATLAPGHFPDPFVDL